MPNPTAPQYVSVISGGVDSFAPGSGLPVINKTGVLYSTQGNIDSLVTIAATQGISLAYSASAPASAAVFDGIPLAPVSVDPRDVVAAVSVGTVNNALYYRVNGSGTCSKIGFLVAVTGGNMCLGVYQNNGLTGSSAAPGNQKGTTGAFATPAAGYNERALLAPVQINEGDWLAISCDSVTATFGSAVASVADALGKGYCANQATAHPLPAAATPLNTLRSGIALIGIV